MPYGSYRAGSRVANRLSPVLPPPAPRPQGRFSYRQRFVGGRNAVSPFDQIMAMQQSAAAAQNAALSQEERIAAGARANAANVLAWQQRELNAVGRRRLMRGRASGYARGNPLGIMV